MKNFLDQLRLCGYKITFQRQKIIEALSNIEQPATVNEIHNQVKKNVPEISFDTIYRNLEILGQLGIVHQIRVRGGDRFELEFNHHHHLICLGCNNVVCLERCPINQEQLAEARKHNFKVINHCFDIYGYCAKCKYSK